VCYSITKKNPKNLKKKNYEMPKEIHYHKFQQLQQENHMDNYQLIVDNHHQKNYFLMKQNENYLHQI
jgi:hypothetical protein